jgi:threonine dehydratase
MVNFLDIKAAHDRIKDWVNSTPILTSRTLNRLVNASISFKCENFQRAGAFKFRGAYNTISQLTREEKEKGVIAHSSGNHAQALALAAKLSSIPCVIVMPENSTKVKIDATKGYGAQVVMCGPKLEDRENTTQELIDKHGYTLIHPYDNENIIAGAGTACYELIQEVGELDFVFCPIGGGGLISGTSIAAKGLLPNVKVIGCEPEKANDAYRSFTSGHLVPNTSIDTIADGLRTSLSERTFGYIINNVDQIITVTEEEIIDAMRFLWERLKIVVEPSGAVSLAGILTKKIDIENKKVGIIISGGNIDLESFFKQYLDRLNSHLLN